jgi:MFS transporter, PPP family, 3-phenylpropionic acid transporter
MAKKSSNITARYAVIQGMYWMSFSVILSFSSVYLLSKNFSNTQIGLVIGVSCTVSAILQPLVAGFADKAKNISLSRIISSFSFIILLLGSFLLISKSKMMLLALLYGMIIIFLQVLNPLVNSLGMECINHGSNLNFGIARGIGSLSYAVISYCVGILLAVYGTVMIPVLIVCIYAIFFFTVYNFRNSKAASGEKPLNLPGQTLEVTLKNQHKKELPFLLRYNRFGILLFGSTLVFVSHNMLNNFLFQIIVSKGGGSTEMGVTMALAAICELPTMFFFISMVKRLRSDIWLKISGIFFMLKAFGTFFVYNVYGMYLIQVLQMFGFALFSVASVYYVNRIMKERDRIKGQAFMTMTNTLGSVLGSLLGGIFIDNIGISVMLIFSIAAAGVGMIIMWFSTKKV